MTYPAKFVEFFGPSTWKTLHSIAFTYADNPNHPTPEEEKAATNLFKSLVYLLPCPSCRTHYEAYITKTPPDTSSREALSKWVYDLHEDVNKRRKVQGLTYEEVKEDYTGWTKDKMIDMGKLSTQERLKSLADPHFGRRIAHHHAEEIQGVLDSPDKLFAVIIVGAAVGGLLYYFYTKEDKRDKK